MKLILILQTAELAGKKVYHLDSNELVTLWRLQLAGYVHVIRGTIYATKN